jgi:amino acid transporter
MYILLSGTHANAIIFGQAVLQASGPGKGDTRLVKFFGIILVVAVAQLQAYSRMNYIRFSNMFAVYKILFLSVITVLGWCALGGQRFIPHHSQPNDNYGLVNLNNAFHGSTSNVYSIALALLDIFRTYTGFENANYVST